MELCKVSYTVTHIPSVIIVLTGKGIRLSPFTRRSHHSTEKRGRRNLNVFFNNREAHEYFSITVEYTQLFSFYHLMYSQTNNIMSECYVLRVGHKHTPDPQQ